MFTSLVDKLFNFLEKIDTKLSRFFGKKAQIPKAVIAKI